MLAELNPKYGMEVWINKKLEEEIEYIFKKMFNTDRLYYYYISYDNSSKKKTVWCGPCRLIDYIKKIQSKKDIFYILGVTSIPNKSGLQDLFDQQHIPSPEDNYTQQDYWLGDINRQGSIVCGDELFIALWSRIQNKATKDSHKKLKTSL